MQSVYIITAEPAPQVELERLSRQLRNLGYAVFSHESVFSSYKKRFHGVLKEPEKVHLRIKHLLTCDYIATLGNWNDDKTCQLEMSVATATGKDTIKILKG